MRARPMLFRLSSHRRSAGSVLFAGTVAALASALALLSGCQSGPQVHVDWRGGPFFTATNYSGLTEMPAEVRRVAVLPLAGIEGLPPDSAAALDSAMRSALLGEARFEIAPVPVETVRAFAGKPAVASTDAMPAGLFARIQHDLGVDAVLLIDITQYRPYAPLALGVRVKLATCSESPEVFWAFDTLYDVRNPAVANSARNYAIGGRPALFDSGAAALQSPSRFASYVFADAFSLLPKRPSPAPPKVSSPTTD